MVDAADAAVKTYMALPGPAKRAAWNKLSFNTKRKVAWFILKKKMCCCC